MDAYEEACRIVREYEEKLRMDELKKARFRAKVRKAKECLDEAIPTILAVTPAALVVGRTVTNIVNNVSYANARRDEKRRRERTVYDRSEMHYWNLKRKLTNKDWARINQLKGSGKRLGDILEEMSLLK